MTGKQLVQGCYAVAWVEVEPTMLELQGRTLYTEPLSHGARCSHGALGWRRIIFSSFLGASSLVLVTIIGNIIRCHSFCRSTK